MSAPIGSTLTDDEMREWARDLKHLAGRAEQEALMFSRRADKVLRDLADRQISQSTGSES